MAQLSRDSSGGTVGKRKVRFLQAVRSWMAESAPQSVAGHRQTAQASSGAHQMSHRHNFNEKFYFRLAFSTNIEGGAVTRVT